jgi:hypothetical protein
LHISKLYWRKENLLNAMKTKTLLFAIFLFVAGTSTAQRTFTLYYNPEFPGLSYGYQFAQNGSILKRGGAGHYKNNQSHSWGLHFRINKYLGIQAGTGVVEYNLGVKDTKYINDNNLNSVSPSRSREHYAGQPGYLGASKSYKSRNAALYLYLPLVKRQRYNRYGCWASMYLAGGMMFNTIKGDTLYTNTYANKAKNEQLLLNSVYKASFNTQYLEIGFSFADNVGFTWNFGLKYVFGSPIMHANYTDTYNGNLLSADKVQATASYLSFSTTIGFTLYSSARHDNEIQKIYAENQKNKPIWGYNNRPIDTAQTITVTGDSISLEFWDYRNTNGDRITIYYNNQVVVSYTRINAQKQELTLPVGTGTNTLVVYIDQAGKVSPANVGFLINDNESRQFVQLRSTRQSSGCIVIRKK